MKGVFIITKAGETKGIIALNNGLKFIIILLTNEDTVKRLVVIKTPTLWQ
jgi:hypothetical protein